MDRKSVWINGKQVFVLPWALAWDALMAAPGRDFMDVWTGKASLADERGKEVSPDTSLRAGQRLYVVRNARRESRRAKVVP
jgi:hypothetical protein